MTLPRPGNKGPKITRQVTLDPLLGLPSNVVQPSCDTNTENNRVNEIEVTEINPIIPSTSKITKRSSGRPFSATWKFFEVIGNKEKCKYCNATVPARPKHVMVPHLLRCKEAKAQGVDTLEVCPDLKNSPEYSLIVKEQAGLLFDQKKI